jgi:hypothetical protein
MITNEEELKATQERILRFQHWLAGIRKTARREEFEAVTSGYRLEIERMQAEVLDYLLRPISAEHEARLP